MDLNKESARLAQLKMSNRRGLEEATLNKPSENKVVMGCGMPRPIGGAKRGRGRPRKSAAAPKKESKKEEKSSKAKKAMEIGEAYGKAIHDEDEDVKELVGSGFFSDFASGFKKGFSSVVSPALKVASMLPIPEAQVAAAVGNAVGLGKKMPEGFEARHGKGKHCGEGKKKAPKKRQASAKMKKRGALVSKLMKKEGMSLGQASKYIKENNLL